MNGYIYTILVVAIIGGIVNSIVSESYGSLKKHINYVVRLICVICLIAPLSTLIKNSGEIKESISGFFDNVVNEEYLDSSNSLIVNTGVDKVCLGIKSTVIDKFGFDENDVIVTLETDTQNIDSITITKINIVLSGKASWTDVKNVKDYIENLVGVKADVTRR
ncbi:MAG: hypothetical protein J6K52_03905 [Clostridia bacterium]|nr:hypothetical protein [Clostridia bacterium]MBP3495330.1 hypothetical protein [Clostridia bacterium]